jgi:hypothetical protein
VTTGTRCPACGSMVRPDASWCSLCHADLRSEEEKAAARPPEPWLDDPAPAPDWANVAPSTELPTAADVTVVADAAEVNSRGRHARPASETAVTTTPAPTNEPQPAAASTTTVPELSGQSTVSTPNPDAVLTKAGVDVDAMMSLLAADQSKPLTPLSSRLTNKGNRAIAAIIAAVALICLGIVAMTLAGLVVH